MLDVLFDALIDTAKLVPLLFISYFLIDYIDKKRSGFDLNYLFIKNLGPVFGALLGIFPQCGFSVIAASLFAQGGISAGTLVACFISTSDEALPMLLANPKEYKTLGLFIVVKVVIAVIAGYLLDLIYHKNINEEDDFEIEISDAGCLCGSNSLQTAIYRTLQTAAFILLVNVVLGFVIYVVGEAGLSTLLNVHPALQILVAGLIGFIPNCAASVVLVQLYFMNTISFGAMIAGLCTGAGIGMAVLIKSNKNRKETFALMAYLYAVAVIAGFVLILI